MAWKDCFSIFDGESIGSRALAADFSSGLVSTEIHRHGENEYGPVVAPVFPEELQDYELAIIVNGARRLKEEHPDTVCRVYLKETARRILPELLGVACEVHIMPNSKVPNELLPFLALDDGRAGGTTFTRIDRFWHAADDVARTKLLGESSFASWRVLDTWSTTPDDYCALQPSGLGTREKVPVRSLLANYLGINMTDGCPPDGKLTRNFLTHALYPRLANEGFLSLLGEVSPPARHWVALDVQHVTRCNPESEIHIVSALKDESGLSDLPTILYKGYEIPVGGVYSSHQRLSVFSPELAKLHESMRVTVRDFHAFAVEKGMRYSLWAGSLLGLFTCGDFLPWDDDVDILIHPDDFPLLEEYWKEAPKASTGYIPYHRSYSHELARVARFGDHHYEFLSSVRGMGRILYKLRSLGGEDLFAYNIGGVDLTTMRCENGQWYERWKLDQKLPPPEVFDDQVDDVDFGGVKTRAYRRDLIEPYLLEKYHPLEWWKHPALSKRDD